MAAKGGLMKKLFAGVIALWIIASGPLEGQISQSTREFMKTYIEQRKDKVEGDGAEVVAFLSMVIRHEQPPPGYLSQVTARANSSKIGGIMDRDLFKKFAAVFAVDLYQHEQDHLWKEAEQK
jgi:hypothetical protein